MTFNDIHWHSFYEMELIQNGRVCVNINGYERVLTRGKLSLLSPYDFHKFDTRGEKAASVLKIGFCGEELSEEIRQLLEKARLPLLLDLNEQEIAAFEKQLGTIRDLIDSDRPYKISVIRRQIELLLLDVLSLQTTGEHAFNAETDFCTDTQVNTIRAVLVHIDTHYGEPIRRDDIAERLHYSPNYLSELFKRMTGCTISDYVTKVRMERAAEMLTTTDTPIRDVIRQTGFRSQSLFYRTFKKTFGVHPGEVRRGAVVSLS